MNHTNTSPRDCQHGRLARSCETCADAEELAKLRADVERWSVAAAGFEAKCNSMRSDHAAALDLVSRVRMALGDNGARMQDELVEWCKSLRADAERYRWLRDTPGSFTVFADACSESMDEDVDAARKDAT